MATIKFVPQSEVDTVLALAEAPDNTNVWGKEVTQGYVSAEPVLPDVPCPTIVGTVGKTNTIVVGDTTKTLLESMMPSIREGNWWIGDTDTGIPATGTDVTNIVQVPGVYEYMNYTFDGETGNLTVHTGGLAVVADGGKFYPVSIMTEQVVTLTASDRLIMVDKAGDLFKTTESVAPAGFTTVLLYNGTDVTQPSRIQDVILTLTDIGLKHSEVQQWHSDVMGVVQTTSDDAQAALLAKQAAESAMSTAEQYERDAKNHAIQTGQDVNTSAQHVQDAAKHAADAKYYAEEIAGGGSPGDGTGEAWNVVQVDSIVSASANTIFICDTVDLQATLPSAALNNSYFHITNSPNSTFKVKVAPNGWTIAGTEGSLTDPQFLELEPGQRIKLVANNSIATMHAVEWN